MSTTATRTIADYRDLRPGDHIAPIDPADGDPELLEVVRIDGGTVVLDTPDGYYRWMGAPLQTGGGDLETDYQRA